MLVLNENQVCPYSTSCQYSRNCRGTDPNRGCTFRCEFVMDDGSIKDGQYRSNLDVTGKMEILTENRVWLEIRYGW